MQCAAKPQRLAVIRGRVQRSDCPFRVGNVVGDPVDAAAHPGSHPVFDRQLLCEVKVSLCTVSSPSQRSVWSEPQYQNWTRWEVSDNAQSFNRKMPAFDDLSPPFSITTEMQGEQIDGASVALGIEKTGGKSTEG